MINSYKKGMTAVEILIVLAILGIIFAVVLPSFKTIKENQILKSTVSDVVSALDKARSNTLASVNSSNYGVYFESSQIVIFKGTSYSPSDVNNENISIMEPATISSINLIGGATEVYFNRLTGAPNKTGTVTISLSSLSKIITISASGAVSMN